MNKKNFILYLFIFVIISFLFYFFKQNILLYNDYRDILPYSGYELLSTSYLINLISYLARGVFASLSIFLLQTMIQSIREQSMNKILLKWTLLFSLLLYMATIVFKSLFHFYYLPIIVLFLFRIMKRNSFDFKLHIYVRIFIYLVSLGLIIYFLSTDLEYIKSFIFLLSTFVVVFLSYLLENKTYILFLSKL
jgi:hypothetical protein